MADYLERLARRTLGQLDVARPDLAPVFAARAIDARDRQSDAPSISPLTHPSPSSGGAPSDVSTRAVLNHDAPRGPFVGPSSIDRTPLSIEPSAIVEATFGRTEMVDHSSVTIAVSAPEPSPMPWTPRRGERVAHWPSTTIAALEAPAARSSERPTVSISIGRIEVRAIAAPASAPTVAKPRSSRLRTLEHYLAERNGDRS